MKDVKFILASNKNWHSKLYDKLVGIYPNQWAQVHTTDELVELLAKTEPEKIFFPHWSELIPDVIHSKFECVVFHMTDLPYGRGGSPLQNLIVRGKKDTVLSALQVVKELDAGPIYLKKPLSLSGKAQDIFDRATVLIGEMILEIIDSNPTPSEQIGDPVIFKRRTPSMSNIANLEDVESIYDYIRMLDAEGYPHAFLETEFFKLEFRNAELDNGVVEANVRIIKK
ncbi:formyl transferase [Ekhidna sp.]